MLRLHLITSTVVLVFCCLSAEAQEDASKSNDKQHSSSFIDASSDSKPREISLGLPNTRYGNVPIYEDGLPVSFNITPIYPYLSWHGGASAAQTSNIGPLETAMRHNEINYYVYSTSRTGIGGKTGGDFSYTFGQYGQHKLDLNVHGPISDKGWYWSVSTYQNFDPGSNPLSCTKYKSRQQFYKGVISKVFGGGKGQMSLSLQYVDYYNVAENYGPFVFVGDGSVKEMDGFRLGHDSYLPEDTEFTFMDVKTGKMVTKNINKDNFCNTFTATFNLSWNFDETAGLVFRSRYKGSDTELQSRNPSSISAVSEATGFTYADGKPYSGNAQYRTFWNFTGYERSWINNAEYRKTFSSNIIAKFGADLNISGRGSANSSAITAHEVCANPKQLYLNGNANYAYNTNAQYYDGIETKFNLYAHYDWKIAQNWHSEGFVRAGFNIINGEAANILDDDQTNKRYVGFNLTKAKITDVKRFNPEWAVGFNVRYKVSPAVVLNIEPIFTSNHVTLSEYCTAYLPTQKATNTGLIRGGVTFYAASNFELTSQLVYIFQNNKSERSTFSHCLTKDVGDVKAGTYETKTIPIEYGISSIGLVTDANWKLPCGFSLHGQLMLRNPKYTNFDVSVSFSDGVTENVSFSGNHITSMPQIEFTLDPSYAIKQWRFWLTARYVSKEYINKTNSLFFAGRIETFAGIDFALNKHVKFKLNLVNLLNQKGASGSIQAADLIEDASKFQNYLMAGTFIRPFTVELGVKINL